MMQTNPDFSDKVFLLVDDQAFVRGMIQGMLKNRSAKNVIHAANGKEALKALTIAEGGIDCVLCDWNMDPVNGIELLRMIRSGQVSNTPRNLCVLLLTGYSDTDIVKAAIQLDANGFLVKPVSVGKLVSAINTGLSRVIKLKEAETYASVTQRPAPESTEIKT